MKAMRRSAGVFALALVILASCGKKPGTAPVSMLNDKDKAYVAKTLGGMKEDVRLVLFSRDGGDCKYCGEVEGMLGDIASAAPRVKVEVLSLKSDAARAKALDIDRVPAIAFLVGGTDPGLRYFGLPSGYEFIPFIETIRSVGNAAPELSRETIAALGKLQKPVQLSVFVTQH
jgi:alkyl hydroperoxide reductase subunit AhpF